jgi:hypothetical protein
MGDTEVKRDLVGVARVAVVNALDRVDPATQSSAGSASAHGCRTCGYVARPAISLLVGLHCLPLLISI